MPGWTPGAWPSSPGRRAGSARRSRCGWPRRGGGVGRDRAADGTAEAEAGDEAPGKPLAADWAWTVAPRSFGKNLYVRFLNEAVPGYDLTYSDVFMVPGRS